LCINQCINPVKMPSGPSKRKLRQLRKMAFQPISQKYYEVGLRLGQPALPPNPDLELVTAARDELVHYLPRHVAQGGGPLPWIGELERRGLLLSAPAGSQFLLAHQLCSYKLAYWARGSGRSDRAPDSQCWFGLPASPAPAGSKCSTLQRSASPPNGIGLCAPASAHLSLSAPRRSRRPVRSRRPALPRYTLPQAGTDQYESEAHRSQGAALPAAIQVLSNRPLAQH
jgi:hypothetical protein